MASSRTLLERLRDPRADAPRTVSQDTEELAESVMNHLRQMLNTRQGNSITAPGYGIPELSEVVHSFPEAMAEVQDAIRLTIETYEPRLRGVRVTPLESEEDPFKLRFEITARLATSKERASVLFQTVVDSAGRVEVRG